LNPRSSTDISEDLGDQLIDLFTTLRFAMQINEATDVVEEAHLIT